MAEDVLRKSWFDEEHGLAQLAAYFQRMESWQQAIADGKITPEELRAQGGRVIALLKELEPLVSDAERQQVTETLYEMAVLQAMQASAINSSMSAPAVTGETL